MAYAEPVERLLEIERKGAKIFDKRADAQRTEPRDGPRSTVVFGSASDAVQTFANKDAHFTVLDFVRSDHMIWSRSENVGSLPSGCLS